MLSTRLKKLSGFIGILSIWLTVGATVTAQEKVEAPEIIMRLELPFPDLPALTIFIARPRKLDADGHPVIIYFEGGGQEEKYAKNAMYSNLAREALRRGYIFISPAAPCRACTFPAKGDRYFPSLFELLTQQLPVRNKKFHLMGYSNGGISSLHLGSQHPNWVASITTLPGALRDPSKDVVAALAPLCITMHVGSKDRPFLRGQRRLVNRFNEIGREINAIEHSKQRHWIKTLATPRGANRLLDDIENSVGCPQ